MLAGTTHDLPLSPPLSPTCEGTIEPECMLLPRIQWQGNPPLLSPPLSAGSTSTSASTCQGAHGLDDGLEVTPRARQRRWKAVQAGDPALWDPLWSQGADVMPASSVSSSAAATFCKPDRLIPRAPIPRSSPLYWRESWESGVSSRSMEDWADWHGGEGHQTLFRHDGQRMAVLPDWGKGQRRRLISLAEALSAAELDEPEADTPARQTSNGPQKRMPSPLLSARMRTLSSGAKGARAAHQGRRTVSAPSSPSPSPRLSSTRPSIAQEQRCLDKVAALPPSSRAGRMSKPMVPISDWLNGQGDTSDAPDPVTALRVVAGVQNLLYAGHPTNPSIAHSPSPRHTACNSPPAGSIFVQVPLERRGEGSYPPGHLEEQEVEVPAVLASSSAVPHRLARTSEGQIQAEAAAEVRSAPQHPPSNGLNVATIPTADDSDPISPRINREPRVSALPAPSHSSVKSPGARVRFADI